MSKLSWIKFYRSWKGSELSMQDYLQSIAADAPPTMFAVGADWTNETYAAIEEAINQVRWSDFSRSCGAGASAGCSVHHRHLALTPTGLPKTSRADCHTREAPPIPLKPLRFIRRRSGEGRSSRES